jgi:hypothetical protein
MVQVWYSGPKVLRFIKTIIFLVKGFKVVAKCYLNWNVLRMTSIVMLNTQLQNMKLRSSIFSVKNDSQKQMMSLVLDIDFMALTILKLGFFWFEFLEFLST